MENKSNHQKLNSFWFSFTLGISFGVALSFLFGTKKGRKTLQKILEMAEALEERGVDFIEEVEKEFNKPTISKTINEIKESSGLGNLIERIKSVSLEKNKSNSFLLKTGKYLNNLLLTLSK